MAHFFLKLIGPRPTFAMDMSESEKALMHEHFLYWKGCQDNGDVLVFGPVMDPNGPYGMGIVSAADDSAARAFASADPAMQANIGFKCEIHPMRAVTRENATS
jgi:uncharacterized protein YciI